MFLLLSAGCNFSEATTDAGLVDGGGGDASVTEAPRVVAVSATGHDRFYGVTFDPAGNFYAVGVVSESNVAATADFETVVAKFTPTGALDTTFGAGGYARRNVAVGLNGEVARGVVVQSTGKVVAVATIEHVAAGADARDRDIALVRFNTDGSRDTTFGADGVVTLDLSDGMVVGTGYVADAAWGLTAYADDRLLVTGAQRRDGGTVAAFAVVRLTAEGARDDSFGTRGVATINVNDRNANPRTPTLLPDGGIVGSGYIDDGGVVKAVLFKLTAAGRPDATFGTGGIFAPTVLAVTTEAYDAIPQGSSFVTAGYGRNATTESLDWVSLRVSGTGVLDPTWGTAGVARIDLARFNDNARALAALPGNRILMVGGGRPSETNVDGMIGVLTATGQADTTFAPRGLRTYDFGGVSDFFWAVAVNPARTHAAIVGARGVGVAAGATTANDDSVVFLLPL